MQLTAKTKHWIQAMREIIYLENHHFKGHK